MGGYVIIIKLDAQFSHGTLSTRAKRRANVRTCNPLRSAPHATS